MLYSVAPRAGSVRAVCSPQPFAAGGRAAKHARAQGNRREARIQPKGLPHPLRTGLGSGSNRRGMSNGAIFGPGTPVGEEEAGNEERAEGEAEKNARPRRPSIFRKETRGTEAGTTPR